MAKRKVRIDTVRRAEVDVQKLVSGLLLLLEELATEQPSSVPQDQKGQA